MKKFKGALGCVGVVAVVIALANVGLWLSNHQELAIAMLMFVGALALFILASAWSAVLLRAGGELAIRSQESDNKLDIEQARLIGEMIRAARQGQPALPPPQQQQLSWLPAYEEGEYSELEERR